MYVLNDVLAESTLSHAHSSKDLDDYIAKNVTAIKPMVEDLERRGCRVAFFELPYPGQLGDYHYVALTLMHAAFPDPKNWPDLDFHWSELRWIDAVHMDERSAIIVAKEIERYIASSPALDGQVGLRQPLREQVSGFPY
jgi:hypothetical protein